MPTYDATSASCFVQAYKEGLLSAVGHDVRLQVQRFVVRVTDEGIEASFDADSLVVVCAMKDGREDPAALSTRDKDTILGYVRKDILESHRFPKIMFRADAPRDLGGELELEGELELHGVRDEVSVEAKQVGEAWVARARIHQPAFGIRPFKALMGALKIKPHVDVELRLPRGAVSEG